MKQFVNPLSGEPTKLKMEVREMEFRKEKFSIVWHYYEDEKTGEKFEDQELIELNMNQLYNHYREKYRLPFPDEIKALREKYNLPANKMAEVLGFGINVYRDYENGQVPSESNARLIQLAKDPKEFRKLLQLSSAFDDEDKKEKLEYVSKIIEEDDANIFNFDLEEYLMGSALPDQYNGYRKGNLDKLRHMVIFFTQKMTPYKTKLNKLLFFADFLNFKQTGYSISGCKYRAIELGPVPVNFNSTLEHFCNEDSIDIHVQEFSNGSIGEKFVPNSKSKFKDEIFSEQELNVLNEINHKFKSASTQKMVDISHEEKGWIENHESHNLISYNKYGWELKNL